MFGKMSTINLLHIILLLYLHVDEHSMTNDFGHYNTHNVHLMPLGLWKYNFTTHLPQGVLQISSDRDDQKFFWI